MKIAAIAGALILPLIASAFEWNAAAGAAYTRSDSWSPTMPHGTRPQLELNLALDARGFIAQPGIFSWSAAAGYARLSDKVNEAPTNLSDTLTYRLQADLLRYRGSPLSLSALAQRLDTRFGTSLTGSDVGERRYDIRSANLALAPPGMPYLAVGYDQQDGVDTIPGLPEHTSERQNLTASLTHSTGAFGLTALYRGEWSDGSWVSDQQQNYAITSTVQSTVGGDGRIFLSDAYMERQPTSSLPGSYGITSHAFQGGYIVGVERGQQGQVQYSYNHGTTTTSTTDQESLGQSVRAQRDLLLTAGESRSWIRFLGDGSGTSQRSLGRRLDTTGVTAGAQYRRLNKEPGPRWEVGGGPVLSYLDAPGASSGLGYGVQADGRLNGDWGARRAGLGYAVDYGSDTYGRKGWALSQSLNASLAGPVPGYGTFSTTLTARARRSRNPVLGDDSTRDLQLDGRLTMKRATLDAMASVSSGIAGTAPGEFVGDGLFLPSGFDSHVIQLRAGATGTLLEGLTSRAEVRFMDSQIPGQPDFKVLEVRGSVAYHYAAFDVSIEDRLSRSEAGAGWGTGNVIMFRISRALGSRY